MRITDKTFFQQPALLLAEQLLGKILVHRSDSGEVFRSRLTDVESYRADDSACHAYRGMTKRNAPMFEAGGVLYIYLCYGLFNIVNIISGAKGEAEGVMIRGVEGADGPGRASRKMQITRTLNREDLTVSEKIWIEDDGFVPGKIVKNKRIGIGYARQEDQERLWRFTISPHS